MDIWELVSDIGYTNFSFPILEEKSQFKKFNEEYFETSLLVGDKWKRLGMITGEPMKHPDFFEVEETGVIAASEKAINVLERHLNDAVELLPIETDIGKFYILNVTYFIDCFNKSKSLFTASNTGTVVSYIKLEFNEKKIGESAIFKIPELPYRIFLSDKIESLCKRQNLRGLEFDPELNLVWYPE